MLLRLAINSAVINASNSNSAVLLSLNTGIARRIAIRHPANPGYFVEQLSLAYPALSTSGTREHGFMIRDRWLSHFIDPLSGLPVEEVASATVRGEYSELLEVAWKLLLLRGCERGLKICDPLG